MDRISIVKESLLHRRSVRTFLDKPIPKDWLDALIEAAVAAPSGSNAQNQRFIVLTDRSDIEALGALRFVWPYKGANPETVKRSHPSGIIGHAAAVIAVFADAALNDARGNGEYYLWEPLEMQNCAASAQNILTLATAFGLGSCWISASESMNHTRLLSKTTWRKAFPRYQIPAHYKIQSLIALGFPKQVDEAGYAIGEKMHGATVWRSTARSDPESYLIQPGPQPDNPARFPVRQILWLCSRSIAICLCAVRALDRIIHRLEHGKLRS